MIAALDVSVTSTELRKPGGFVEMGFYSPDASGARQLRAVISRQCVGGKWCLYFAHGVGDMAKPVMRFRVKRLAVITARAWSEDATRRAHGEPVKAPELARLIAG